VADEQTARDFFASLPGRVEPARAAELSSVYGFDIADAGQWTVTPTAEGIQVAEGLNDPDVTMLASEDVFMRIVSGEQNPTTAYMTGKLKIKGDMGAAMKLSKLF
jgi:putative sterol carrier protein